MNTAIDRIHLIVKWILIFLMVLMVVDVVWQVFTRFILRYPSSVTEEIATFLLIWVGLLGAAYALHEKAHLGIDLISSRLSGKNRRYSSIFTYCTIVVIAISVFVAGGSRLVYITLKLEQVSPALQIKMGYIYSVIPISGLLMVFYSIGVVYNSMLELKHSETVELN